MLENTNEIYAISELRSIDLLRKEDLDKLRELLPELRHNWETQTIWRTETLMRYSVLNDIDCPDRESKYYQAKTEQLVFFEQLFTLAFEYQKQLKKLEIIEAEVEELQDKLNDDLKSYQIKKIQAEIGIKEIEKKELAYNLENMKIQARERMREIVTWSKIKNELDDGSFDIDDVDKSQLISLMRRYIQVTWAAVSTNNQNDPSSMVNILAHYETLGRECISRGIMEEVLEPFRDRPEIIEFVKYGFGSGGEDGK